MVNWRSVWIVTVLMGCAGDTDKAEKSSSSADSGLEACEPRTVTALTADFFTDISESSGIQKGNYDPEPPDGTSINDHSRLAFADINTDGLDDIVFCRV